MALLFLLPTPDFEAIRNVLQPIFILGLAGAVVALLALGTGFLFGYLVYMNATKDRDAPHN
jgi:hypothetical protein